MELKNIDIKMNQYINGELTGEVLQQFEQLLASDSQLAKEFALHKKIDQTLIAKNTDKNKEEREALFQQFGEKYILSETDDKAETKVVKLKPNKSLPDQKANNNNVLKWLAPVIGIAAAAMLIFFIGFGDANPQQLAQQYFEPTVVDFTARGGEANNLSEAQEAYDNQNYQKAMSLFSEHPNNSQAQMAKGNCEFLLDLPKKAAETFQQLSEKNIDQSIKVQAQWYLSLAYLKQDNIALATNELKAIPEGSPNHKKAQLLLKELKQ